MVGGRRIQEERQRNREEREGQEGQEGKTREEVGGEEGSIMIDNFYRYVNDEWLKTTRIPDGYSRWSSYQEVEAIIKGVIKGVLSNERNAGYKDHPVHYMIPKTIYNAYVDTDKLEREGWSIAKLYLDYINKCATKQDLMGIVSHYQSYSIPIFVELSIQNDLKQSNINRLYISYSNLIVPDRDYYLIQNQENIDALVNLKTTITKISQLYNLGWNTDDIIELDTRIAKIQPSTSDKRQLEKYYKFMKVQDFIDHISNHIDEHNVKKCNINKDNINKDNSNALWNTFFNTLPFDVDNIVCIDIDYFVGLTNILLGTKIETIKSYIEYMFLYSMSDTISDELETILFEYYGKTIAGQKSQKPRWIRALDTLDKLMEKLIGRLYVENYYDPKCGDVVMDMIYNLIDAFGTIIQNATWITNVETKQLALDKLHNMGIKVGHPDVWERTAKLVLDDNLSLLEMILIVRKANEHGMFNAIDKMVTGNEWEIGAHRVNSYYSDTQNELVIPAGLMLPPFFDMSRSAATNYGAIGAIIAHEITHGFDDLGSKYDANGNLNTSLWSLVDKDNYNIMINRIQQQFSSYEYYGKQVNGKLTVGENIADLGGLTIAFNALQNIMYNDNSGDVNNKHNNDDDDNNYRDFFQSWATTWRDIMYEKTAHELLTIDPHIPGELRANAVNNLDIIYDLYNINPSSFMYLQPEDRVQFWQ